MMFLKTYVKNGIDEKLVIVRYINYMGVSFKRGPTMDTDQRALTQRSTTVNNISKWLF